MGGGVSTVCSTLAFTTRAQAQETAPGLGGRSSDAQVLREVPLALVGAVAAVRRRRTTRVAARETGRRRALLDLRLHAREVVDVVPVGRGQVGHDTLILSGGHAARHPFAGLVLHGRNTFQACARSGKLGGAPLSRTGQVPSHSQGKRGTVSPQSWWRSNNTGAWLQFVSGCSSIQSGSAQQPSQLCSRTRIPQPE